MKKWNWRSFFAGSITTTLIFGCGATAFASNYMLERISFNSVKIGTSTATITNENNSYTLQNGEFVPYSIVYTSSNGGGTVYLPIRKISEFTQTGIEWDGANNKVVIDADTTAEYKNMTGSYSDGYSDGYNDALSHNSTSSNYNSGYNDGYNDGYDDGKKVNSTTGSYQTGYNDGYTAGYNAGKGSSSGNTSDRYQEGYDAGFTAGKTQGVTEGEKSGYDKGFAEGEESGYQEGYEDGYADGKIDSEIDPDEKPTDYKYYSEFPTVPDFGDVTDAKSSSPAKNTLEKGIAYDYDLIDYQESLSKYIQVLKECGFSQTNAMEENYGVTYIYRRGDIYVHVGVKASMMTNGIGIPTYTDAKFSDLAQDVQRAKQAVITANTERPIYDVVSGQWVPDQAAIKKANEALSEAQKKYDDYLNKAINTYSVVIEKW